MLSAALACPRQFYWNYIRGLRPKAQSIHLTAGGAFAAGLEAYRMAYYAQEAGHRPSLAAAFRAAVSYWGPYEPPMDTNKSLPAVLEALQAYFTEWWPAETDLLQPHRRRDGAPSVEFSFSIPLPGLYHPETNDPLFYVGRLDMLGTFNGQLFVVDEKTTSQMGAAWTKNWDLRGQFTGYVWAAKELLSLPVVGAIVRGVCFRKYDLDHAEVLTYRPAWLVDEWMSRTQEAIAQCLQWWDRDLYFPNHDNSCTAYGGCKYLPLCTKADPEPWIAMDYEVDRWDPLGYEHRKLGGRVSSP